MKQEDPKYESIRSKLIKLLALADRGVQGEAENAKRAIERICEEYGIDIEDFFDTNKTRKYVIEIGRGKDLMQLFLRCISSVCDIKGMTYRQMLRSSIELELTSMQYAEILSLFNWHKGNYERELKDFKRNFLLAYVGKHQLFFDSERTSSSNINELSKEELQRLFKIWKLRESMSDYAYRKQLKTSLDMRTNK